MLPSVASRWPLGKRALLSPATEYCTYRTRHLAGREARALSEGDFKLSILIGFHGNINLSKEE